jgi:signal transduction histidine kinase
MGEMAGGLAHQLRNSLGAIAGYGRLARRKLDGAGLPVGSVDSLLDETDQAAALIRQFLDFTRPFSLSRSTVAVDELLAEIVESFSVRQGHEKVRIEVERVEKAQLEIDPLLFKQAIANLVDNAISSYVEEHGTVWLSAVVSEDGYRITVRDAGCGIPETDRERIFTPFFSSKPSGTGLGLPLAGKIVDLHDGRIILDSREGEGTSFAIILPLSSVKSTATPAFVAHA